MAERYGADWIKATLAADATVIGLVAATYHYAASIVPDSAPKSTINFYMISPFNGRSEHFERTWSVDCRAENEVASQAIAAAALVAFNRYSSSVGGFKYFGVCSITRTIPPRDAGDVFNTPVELYIRRH